MSDLANPLPPFLLAIFGLFLSFLGRCKGRSTSFFPARLCSLLGLSFLPLLKTLFFLDTKGGSFSLFMIRNFSPPSPLAMEAVQLPLFPCNQLHLPGASLLEILFERLELFPFFSSLLRRLHFFFSFPSRTGAPSPFPQQFYIKIVLPPPPPKKRPLCIMHASRWNAFQSTAEFAPPFLCALPFFPPKQASFFFSFKRRVLLFPFSALSFSSLFSRYPGIRRSPPSSPLSGHFSLSATIVKFSPHETFVQLF